MIMRAFWAEMAFKAVEDIKPFLFELEYYVVLYGLELEYSSDSFHYLLSPAPLEQYKGLGVYLGNGKDRKPLLKGV